MNEWEFTGDAASWINEFIGRIPGLPFSRAKCEKQQKGSRKRRDLTLLDKDERTVLTGEVKLPYRKDGNTPYNAKVIHDARGKARRARVDFFFTWNVNDFVLWQTEGPTSVWQDRNYKKWHVTDVRNEADLERPIAQSTVRKWLEQFLPEFAQIVRGTAPIGIKTPDEKFIEVLESSLHVPILLVFDELLKLYQRKSFKRDLDRWMREEQNWVILDDPEGVRDNLERTSKFACYSLVNKLVFHEALLKRYRVKMSKLAVPKHVTAGEQLRTHIEGYFAKAKVATGDYETVFGEEQTGIGNRIPFYSDQAVSHWRELIEQIHQYDFTQLDHEVIGSIFERLIGPEERKKFGQFYTRVEVVDLINSFCIQNGDEKVMDPACGAGTFLVRAYGRKKELQPQRSHTELLTDLYGIDVARYATEWTTINLATRELVEEGNYPLVKRGDFFDVTPRSTILSMPNHTKAKSKGKKQHRNIGIEELDAMIGNLPYIRQEAIRRSKTKSKSKSKPERGTKEFYQQLAKTEGNTQLSGRSDIHCYFWPHAKTFLKENGYLCFLTSSQWLDVEYGFRLQEWLLRNFEIKAILESIDEPWFVGARVATTVTIAQLQPDEQERMDNKIRFVQLRKPMRELLGAADHTMAAAVQAADAFRDEILALTENTINERYRARLVRQGDLWEEGVRLGRTMSKAAADDDEEPTEEGGKYYGGKWGVFLRAPDLWFELLDKYGDRLVPLGEIAEIRRGITSGNDAFFFPIDNSVECLQSTKDAREFEREFGVPRREVSSGKVKLVKCGEGHGEIRPIEAKYLEPEVHSLMEVDAFAVQPESCSRMVLLVNKSKRELSGNYVQNYIKWGESKGFHKGPTCAGRATRDQEWYDLTRYKRAAIILPKIQQYRLFAFLNKQKLYQNSSLLGLYDLSDDDAMLYCGILNSTIAILSRLIYSRILGNEGNIQLDVYSAKMMLVPNVHRARSKLALKKIGSAFKRMTNRKALAFLPERRLREMAFKEARREADLLLLSDKGELDMQDRKELDNSVLEFLGIKNVQKRARLLDCLYGYLKEHFEFTRQKEEKAIINKAIAKRRGGVRTEDVASEILEDIKASLPELLRKYDGDFLDTSKLFDTYEVPLEGYPQYAPDMMSDSTVAFVKGRKGIARIETLNAEQSELLVLVVKSGLRGFIRVPHDARECRRIFQSYEAFVLQREQRIRDLIDERTADEDLQEKIYEILMSRVMRA